MLGLSAALFGTKVDANGPRWAMVVASSCFVGGFLISALGCYIGQFWLVVVGYGFLGGIGLGIGYISPVSTLIKWFPDRPGLSTGIAIMGFGGGALIASPLTTQLLAAFGGTGQGATAAGVGQTFLVMGIIYAIFMSVGWLLVRVPPDGWRPAGWTPPTTRRAGGQVRRVGPQRDPHPAVLAALGGALLQRHGGHRHPGARRADLDGLLRRRRGRRGGHGRGRGLRRVAVAREHVWAASGGRRRRTYLGRKNMYRVYLGVGALLYLTIMLTTNSNQAIFLICSMLILSFYGGGFATVPAYLRDLFGTYQVGAIHGRLLTAWSVAGVLGPLIVNAIADAQIAAKVSGPARYTTSFIIMIVLLVIGFICNELIKPVADKFHEERSTATTGAQA